MNNNNIRLAWIAEKVHEFTLPMIQEAYLPDLTIAEITELLGDFDLELTRREKNYDKGGYDHVPIAAHYIIWKKSQRGQSCIDIVNWYNREFGISLAEGKIALTDTNVMIIGGRYRALVYSIDLEDKLPLSVEEFTQKLDTILEE